MLTGSANFKPDEADVFLPELAVSYKPQTIEPKSKVKKEKKDKETKRKREWNKEKKKKKKK